ncbi:MAG TPA: hypothetical protein VNQ77_20005 [Frankiaceae bacterium]|nr:hypothetical protein [Frankiaceae bacterium]
MTVEADERLRLVYDESQRAVADQREAMADLRTRAAHLLAAASVVVTFLLGLGLGDTTPGAGTWIATGAFTLLALICVGVMLPTDRWRASFSATLLLDGFVDADPPATLDTMHRQLAKHMEINWDRIQDRVIRPRRIALDVAVALLLVCVVAAVSDLPGRHHDVPSTKAQGSPGPARGAVGAVLHDAGPVEVRVAARAASAGAQAAGAAQHRGLHPGQRRQQAPPGLTCARPPAPAATRDAAARAPPPLTARTVSARNGPSAWDDHSS